MKVIICGSGLAGLGAAIALRCPGREIVVLEQGRLNQEIGACVQTPPNATKILRKWGLDMLQHGSVASKGVHQYNSNGTLDFKEPQAPWDAPLLFNHRGDLHAQLKLLATAPGKGCSGAQIITDQDCGGGIVTTQDGTVYKGDLVVAADGINSVIRSLVLGFKPAAEPCGITSFRTLIAASDLSHMYASRQNIDWTLNQGRPEMKPSLDATGSVLTQIVASGFQRRLLMYPCRDAQMLDVLAFVPDVDMDPDLPCDWRAFCNASELSDHFTDFPAWAQEVLLQGNQVRKWQLRVHEPLSTWVRGRTILIGDAAHSMVPHLAQGASQAFEDAEALGAFFAHGFHGKQQAQTINRVLQAVFDVRYARVTTIQAVSTFEALGDVSAVPSLGKAVLPLSEFWPFNHNYNGAIAWQQAMMG